MADTYYFRLTSMSPQKLNSMNSNLGVVIAETATTGKFFIQEVSFDQLVSPNGASAVAYNITGDIKIAEPLGARFLDYLRYAAIKNGVQNHLDARYILDVEIRAENFKAGEFVYSFPIMLLALEAKTSISEKGTEYIIRFGPAAHHSQTDMTQPIKDSITVEGVQTLKDYFKGLGRELELAEFKAAKARQKDGATAGGGGDHPATAEPTHDEYHFILDPVLDNMKFTSKDSAEVAKNGFWGSVGHPSRWFNDTWDITAKSGSTIVSQITRVLQQSDGISELLPGRKTPQAPDGQGSSPDNQAANEASMGDIYQFFRVETHTVYKAFDTKRSRYAVKHIFAIFLADQPNMYQYPDEVDLLNANQSQGKVLGKLNQYITRGLLRKAYYHYYTGLNMDIIRANLQFNMMYFLPSFPTMWTDRGKTSDGPINKQNYNREQPPQAYGDTPVATTPWMIAEDTDYGEITNTLKNAPAALRPRMEPDNIVKQADDPKSENEHLVEKLFAVQCSERDLMELELEIFGDPYWLGVPNLMMAGAKGLAQIGVNDGIRAKITAEMPAIDPEFASRNHGWSNYEQAQYYKGGNLIYYNAQLPVNDGQNDLMEFSTSDQIVGIYMVWKVKNEFKEGKWTQTLSTKRDITIPSKFLPLSAMGGASGSDSGFEAYVNNVLATNAQPGASGSGGSNPSANSGGGAPTETSRSKELQNENIGKPVGPDLLGARGVETQQTQSSNPRINAAKNTYDNLAKDNPPPTVNNPVERAKELASSGLSKDQAYQQAKTEYSDQLKSRFEHENKLNEQAFKAAGVDKYKPYSAETMASLAMQKSNGGGLEDWKKNTNWKGPASVNNPGGLGHNARTGTYNSYKSFDDGIKAMNGYYNYGEGVPAGRHGKDRFLLPSGTPKTSGNSELQYIDKISKGRPPGG